MHGRLPFFRVSPARTTMTVPSARAATARASETMRIGGAINHHMVVLFTPAMNEFCHPVGCQKFGGIRRLGSGRQHGESGYFRNWSDVNIPPH